MSYALRNTLIIGAFLALLLSGGLYWVRGHLPKRIKALEGRIKERGEYLDQLSQIYEIYSSLESQLDSLRQVHAGRKKALPPSAPPSVVLAYIDRLLRTDRSGLTFTFDFQTSVDRKDYGYTICRILGEGPFQDLYKFLWRIEHGQPLVKLTSLHLQRREKVIEDRKAYGWVSFDMILEAYYSPKYAILKEPWPVQVGVEAPVTYNFFYPLILPELPPNDENLPEVEGAKLLAITGDRVYIKDGKGRLASLREGDRVYLGKLAKIDRNEGRAIFLLNEGGIFRRVELRMPVSEGGYTVAKLLKVRAEVTEEGTVVEIRTDRPVRYRHFTLNSPDRVVVDLWPVAFGRKLGKVEGEWGPVRRLRYSQYRFSPPTARVVVDLEDLAPYEVNHEGNLILLRFREE